MVLAILAIVVVAGGWKYAADPSGEKDCGPLAPRATGSGQTINDVSCLNPTPVRDVVAVFAAMVNPTVPLPAPVAPDDTVIQETPLVAVQLQVACAVTLTLVVSPAATAALLVGLSE